jgi:uncharacterized protein (TIGR02145 family)
MRFTITLFMSLIVGIVSAQAPQGVGYQGVATDSEGIELVTQAISIRASILSGSVNGTVQWQETHDTSTDEFGLFALIIGEGENTGSGLLSSFADIPWGESTYFLQIEMDATGGMDYSLMGVNQMMSVPYALYAESTNLDYDSIANYLSGDSTFVTNISNGLGGGGCSESIEYYGDTYNIVELNGRCWFAENLRYLPNVSSPFDMSNDSAMYYVHDYFGNQTYEAQQTVGFEDYGVYYNHIAIGETQICPSGWSVPTFYQWVSMLNSIAVNYLLNSTPDFYNPKDLLEDIGEWSQQPDYYHGGFIENGTNFSLKPSGFLYIGPTHGYLATEGNSNMAIKDNGGWVEFSGAFIYLYSGLQPDRAYCVRCIKD